MTKLVMVETLSQFRHRYVIKLQDDAMNYVASDYVKYNDHLEEMSQYHLGEVELSTREITKEEYLKLFDEDNQYLVGWPEESKLKMINKTQETE
jgi:hypothetical protein